MEDSAKEKPSTKLEHPFERLDSKKDEPQQMIFGLLGEITNPTTSIANLIRSREAWRLANERLTPDQNKDLLEGYISNKLQTLRNTGPMIDFRDAAQNLYERYTSSALPLQSTRQAYFLRKASQLWEKMQNYVDEYLEFNSGRVQVGFEEEPALRLKLLKDGVERALKIHRDIKDGKDSKGEIDCNILIPKESNNRWDRDNIRINFDPQGKIIGLAFDELSSYSVYCVSRDQILEAYKKGVVLTYSQKRLLKDHFGMDISEGERETNAPVLSPDVEIMGITPIEIFPYLIKPPLSERIRGHSFKHFYSTNQQNVGPLMVNYRFHDYGENQRVINLDTRELTNDEAYQLIEVYLEALQYFPRVPQAKD